MGAEAPIPTDDPDSCAKFGARWRSGQRSIMGCILHTSRGNSFWPIRPAWQIMPAILHGGPMELHGKEPPSSLG
jgi:hypothetical protein